MNGKGVPPFGGEIRLGCIKALHTSHFNSVMAVDFGTSNSLGALNSKEDGTLLVQTPEGQRLVPSIVSFLSDLSYVVGDNARPKLRSEPTTTVGYIKRLLGSDKAFSVYGKTVFPHDVASLIIKSIKTNAEELCGRRLSDVVASVPLIFFSTGIWLSKGPKTSWI